MIGLLKLIKNCIQRGRGRKRPKSRFTRIAEGIKLEKQKGVQKNILASNTSALSPLWPETGHKILAVFLPHAVLASIESSLLLSLTLLA